MKKTKLLNSELSYIVSKLGHYDTLTIGDCGLPIPKPVQRVDLAVTFGVPSFKEVFESICTEAVFQKVTISIDTKEQNPEFYAYIYKWAEENKVEVVEVPHPEFKKQTGHSVAVVRTGECKPFSNVILEAGVSF